MMIASVAKTGRAVVAHEAVRAFGVGAEVAATLMSELFGRLKAPVKRLGAPYAPVPFAKNLEDAYVLSAETIAEAARETVAHA